MSEKLLIRVPEAADRMSVSRSLAYRWAQEGTLPGLTRIGKSLRVNVRQLEDWLDRAAVVPPERVA